MISRDEMTHRQVGVAGTNGPTVNRNCVTSGCREQSNCCTLSVMKMSRLSSHLPRPGLLGCSAHAGVPACSPGLDDNVMPEFSTSKRDSLVDPG